MKSISNTKATKYVYDEKILDTLASMILAYKLNQTKPNEMKGVVDARTRQKVVHSK